MKIEFTIPGEPQGKGRARIGRVGGQARMFTPGKTVAYEGLVAFAGRQSMIAMGLGRPLEGPLRLFLECVHTIPASWSKKRRQEAINAPCQSKPDLDNIVKAIGDGGNGVIWVDDKQITQLAATKVYGERAEVRVTVESVIQGAA